MIRLWTKNGTQKRSVSSVADSESGDFIPNNQPIPLSKLGINKNNRTLILYIEAVSVSSELADIEIAVEYIPY